VRALSFGTSHAAARLLVLAACLALFPGCYSKRFKAIDYSLAALTQQADSLANEHAKTRADLAELRKEYDQAVRSLRAGSQTRSEELVGRIEQLESRLEDQSQRLDDLAGRARTRSTVLDTATTAPVVPPPAPASKGSVAKPPAPSAGASSVKVDPTAAYDQAVLDFTQGRFPLALSEFRAFVAQHGATDLGDNAQYGVGESFYAVGQYDSAAAAYRDVIERWPSGDKVPAALYKLGIAYQKANRSPEARTTYNTLIEKYPRSGEARLAGERLKEMDQR
jgi:tol-pal system protein YbgF